MKKAILISVIGLLLLCIAILLQECNEGNTSPKDTDIYFDNLLKENTDKNNIKLIYDEHKEKISELKKLFPDVPVFILPQTYNYNCPKAWQSKKWFKDDYCQGPGNIFYVHTNGKIAPCCGFANEEPALFIGSICDSYEKLMQNAKENPMIKSCFNTGLHKKIKEWNYFVKVVKQNRPH